MINFKINTPNIFLILTLSFLGGVLMATFFFIPWIWIIFGLSFIVGFLIFTKDKIILLATISFLALILGASYYQIDDNLSRKGWVDFNNEEEKELTGVIIGDIERKDFSNWIRVRLESPSQKILLKVSKEYRDFQYGDKIKIIGEVEEVENFDDFDFKNYLAKERIFRLMNYPKIFLLEKNQGNILKGFLMKIKYSFSENINRLLPNKEANLLNGLILGEKSDFSDDFREKMNNSGTSHLVALSGFNITIIIGAVLSFLLFIGLSRNYSFWISILFISLFVIITGASLSIIRAAVMGVMAILAVKLGWKYSPRNSLFLAGLIMVLFNPKIIRFDVGFQLSFLATTGLVYFTPFFGKIFRTSKQSFLNWRENISLTLSAQVAVLPLLIIYFGRISLISPISNILILTIVPLAMFLGFLAVIIGFISSIIGTILILPSYFLLKYIIWVIEISGGLGISSIDLGDYREIFFWLAISLVLFFSIFVFKRGRGVMKM